MSIEEIFDAVSSEGRGATTISPTGNFARAKAIDELGCDCDSKGKRR
jgi:hypothetical protein